jgi:ankyrin repeat protein
MFIAPQVKLLIHAGAEVRCRAWGPFFQAGRHCTRPNAVYLGELPLSFAACTGQKDVVSYLKRHGARVNQDGDI